MRPLILLTISLASPLLSDDPPKDWTVIKTQDGKFRFAMPAKPEEQKATLKTKAGEVSVTGYTCSANQCIYTFERMPIPEDVVENDKDAYLDAFTLGMSRNAPAFSRKNRPLAGNPGRVVKIGAPPKPGADPLKVEMMVVLVGRESITIRVIALEPGTEPKDVEAFFRSLRVPTAVRKGE
jgi:hypothetical protein